MRAHSVRPQGKNGCQKTRVRPQSNNCPKVATVVRFTGKVTVNLCSDCDSKFGTVVGVIV
jgi:hypothetical protein